MAIISSQTPSRDQTHVTDPPSLTTSSGLLEKLGQANKQTKRLLTRLFLRLSRINVTDCAELFIWLELLVLPGRFGGQLAAAAAVWTRHFQDLCRRRSAYERAETKNRQTRCIIVKIESRCSELVPSWTKLETMIWRRHKVRQKITEGLVSLFWDDCWWRKKIKLSATMTNRLVVCSASFRAQDDSVVVTSRRSWKSFQVLILDVVVACWWCINSLFDFRSNPCSSLVRQLRAANVT